MTSQTGKQIITIHIMPNISRSKDNEVMRFGQLIEHYLFQNTYRKGGRETSSRRLFCFSKKLYER